MLLEFTRFTEFTGFHGFTGFTETHEARIPFVNPCKLRGSLHANLYRGPFYGPCKPCKPYMLKSEILCMKVLVDSRAQRPFDFSRFPAWKSSGQQC